MLFSLQIPLPWEGSGGGLCHRHLIRVACHSVAGNETPHPILSVPLGTR